MKVRFAILVALSALFATSCNDRDSSTSQEPPTFEEVYDQTFELKLSYESPDPVLAAWSGEVEVELLAPTVGAPTLGAVLSIGDGFELLECFDSPDATWTYDQGTGELVVDVIFSSGSSLMFVGTVTRETNEDTDDGEVIASEFQDSIEGTWTVDLVGCAAGSFPGGPDGIFEGVAPRVEEELASSAETIPPPIRAVGYWIDTDTGETVGRMVVR